MATHSFALEDLTFGLSNYGNFLTTTLGQPDYDKLKDPAERRLAYVRSFQEMRRYHTGGMLHLALNG